MYENLVKSQTTGSTIYVPAKEEKFNIYRNKFTGQEPRKRPGLSQEH
jgi:hypothetical protein